ncbi:hypothetical protein [Streptomyces sp. NPDC058683]|uniref:hypothetical protein n=1 Tax=Streptomyces sp. NPDC058683 TaxID=3346597 RepID=UPI0036609140
MSDSEQSGEDLRAWAARMEQEGGSDEPADDISITDFGGTHILASRLHGELPTELWTTLRMIPEPNPDLAAEFDSWARQFVPLKQAGEKR